MKKRPTDKDVSLRDIAKSLTKEVSMWLNEKNTDEQEIEDMLLVCLEYLGISCDGYEFAKMLENDYHFCPDSQLVDILDGMWSTANHAKEQLVKQWVVDNNITPKLKVGDDVIINVTKFIDKKPYKGKIKSVDEKLAKYSIFVPELGHVETGTGTHATIQTFEEVEILNIK